MDKVWTVCLPVCPNVNLGLCVLEVHVGNCAILQESVCVRERERERKREKLCSFKKQLTVKRAFALLENRHH